jgi:hypothetical protein
MTQFTSLYNLFEPDLPEGWTYNHAGNVYTFINVSEAAPSTPKIDLKACLEHR